MPTLRVTFARDDGSFDQADLEVGEPSEDGVTCTLASGPTAASAWAWAHAQILDRLDRSPKGRARAACAAIAEAAQAASARHETHARGLVEAHGWKLAQEYSAMYYLDALGPADAFVVFQFDAHHDTTDRFVVVPPILLDLPPGLLPADPCGQCQFCRVTPQTPEAPRQAPPPTPTGSSPYAIVEVPGEALGAAPAAPDPTAPTT